jgi:hypothetical protein
MKCPPEWKLAKAYPYQGRSQMVTGVTVVTGPLGGPRKGPRKEASRERAVKAKVAAVFFLEKGRK